MYISNPKLLCRKKTHLIYFKGPEILRDPVEDVPAGPTGGKALCWLGELLLLLLVLFICRMSLMMVCLSTEEPAGTADEEDEEDGA